MNKLPSALKNWDCKYHFSESDEDKNNIDSYKKEKQKYSYRDCWIHALSICKDLKLEDKKNDMIALCQTSPEEFWLNFSNNLLSASDYLNTCHKLNKWVKNSYPIPYLTNQVCFYGLNFYVEKGVFIPQPDTEILVKKTLELADKMWGKNKKLKVLDVGTGCGSIAISLAKNRPKWSFTGIDVDEKSLKVAKINSTIHQVKNIRFVYSDLFRNIGTNEKFDIVISNPPYVSNKEYELVSSFVKKQPKKALIAKDNGYFFYQKIFQGVNSFLNKKFLLMLEIGYSQKEKVVKIIINNFPQIKVFVFFDQANNPRVVVAKQSWSSSINKRLSSSVG